MPAGDLVVADYQFELRTTLMGEGSNYLIVGAPTGFGVPAVKSADVELHHDDGSYGSPDYHGVRVITIPLEMTASTASTAMQYFDALVTAWAPSTTDIPLYFRLPYWGKKYVNGRPRGLSEDLSKVPYGIVRAIAVFVALDPTINT